HLYIRNFIGQNFSLSYFAAVKCRPIKLSYAHRHLSRQAQTRQLKKTAELILFLYPPTARNKDWIILAWQLKQKGH
ncbi:MAG: hypothetical protein WBM78_06770, partial [Desulfobacterales bacterium]